MSGIQWLVQGIWGPQLSLSGGCDDFGLGHISHPKSFTLENKRVNPQEFVSSSFVHSKMCNNFLLVSGNN